MPVLLLGSYSHADVTLGLPHSQKDAQQVDDEFSAIAPSTFIVHVHTSDNNMQIKNHCNLIMVQNDFFIQMVQMAKYANLI